MEVRRKVFSTKEENLSVEDKDYLRDIKGERKSVKHAPLKGAGIFGLAGGLVGTATGASLKGTTTKKPLVGGIIGTGLGTAGGYLLGKSNKKRYLKELDKREEEYLKSNKKDRKAMRDQLRDERLVEAMLTGKTSRYYHK